MRGIVIVIRASLPSGRAAVRVLPGLPLLAPGPARTGNALPASRDGAMAYGIRGSEDFADTAHLPVSVPSVRIPASTRLETEPARLPWLSVSGARLVR